MAYVDDRGRVLDFHGLGHSFATNLNHTPSRVAQSLARHKTSAMTDRYTHDRLNDERAALAILPDLTPNRAMSGREPRALTTPLPPTAGIYDTANPVSGKWGAFSGALRYKSTILRATRRKQKPRSRCRERGYRTRPKGLEPSTFGSTVRCSGQLSYGPEFHKTFLIIMCSRHCQRSSREFSTRRLRRPAASRTLVFPAQEEYGHGCGPVHFLPTGCSREGSLLS